MDPSDKETQPLEISSKSILQNQTDSDGQDEVDEVVDLSEDFFCEAYYKVEYREIRMQIIKELFKELTVKWNRNFVMYPLSSSEDVQDMVSRFYFILYEVDAPLKIRFERFTQKYKK